MTKILVCGDSFAADWTVKYKDKKGWPNLLAEEFDVTNIAQAGCSEYKIYKQLLGCDLSRYDVIVVSHTSPYRIYIEKKHPVHGNDLLHKDSDLIFTDLEEHNKTKLGLNSILEFFTKFYSLEYAEFVHDLLCEKIIHMLKGHRVIHITNINRKYQFDILNFNDIFSKHRGLMNHFSDVGNQIIVDTIKKEIYKE